MSDTSSAQFLRAATLIVAADDKGLDLSDMHFTFEIRQIEQTTPNTALIRVFNLKEETVQQIWGTKGALSEFTKVILQAGYVNGPKGMIFKGTIKQLRRGKMTGYDTFLDILAASFDVPYNFAYLNQTLAPEKSSPADQQQAIGDALKNYGAETQFSPIVGGIRPRGKVLFGLAAKELRFLGTSTGTTYFFEGNVLKSVPLTGYLPDEVVVLNSGTGLIGMPETTQNGITATALLNPKIRIGTRVQINNKELNKVRITDRAAAGPNAEAVTMFASESADGVYKVIVHEMEGDTRGNSWYSRLVLLDLDSTVQPDLSIKKFG